MSTVTAPLLCGAHQCFTECTLACVINCSQLGPRIHRSSSLNVKWEDMVRMEDVNSATILHNLRIRFKDGEIYTNIGKILVSINPFKWETSEVFYNAEWVSVFRNADPDDPIPYVPRTHPCLCRVSDLCPSLSPCSHQ